MNDPSMHNDADSSNAFSNSAGSDTPPAIGAPAIGAPAIGAPAIGATASDLPGVELLGVLDMVEAFTALRQELKLQVRSGRDAQQAFSDGLQRIEQRIAAVQTNPAATPSTEGRKLAEAIAEIDESLQRAVDSLNKSFPASKAPPTWLASFDATVAQAPWLARNIAAGTFSAIRKILEQAEQETLTPDKSQQSTLQGFEILIARVRRQMQQAEIERVDVLGEPFDAEIMNAIDMIDAPTVAKSHVAEQLRPAYRWRGSLLRYADVRLAK